VWIILISVFGGVALLVGFCIFFECALQRRKVQTPPPAVGARRTRMGALRRDLTL
jgi:hypothetical protein